MSKPLLSLAVSIALAILVAGGSGLAASAEPPRGGALGCRWPIDPDETGQAILERFGHQARVAALSDSEGEIFPGLMLYPDAPTLRLEIETQSDPIRSKVSRLGLREKHSKWTAFGLEVGMTLEDVTKANGGPLDLWGFQQFGRGGVYSVLGHFRPGKLKGGCRLLVIFTAPEGAVAMPGPLYGLDHIASDNPDLLRIGPIVTELAVSWEPPPE